MLLDQLLSLLMLLLVFAMLAATAVFSYRAGWQAGRQEEPLRFTREPQLPDPETDGIDHGGLPAAALSLAEPPDMFLDMHDDPDLGG